MDNTGNFAKSDIIRDYNNKKKYEEIQQKKETLAQFELYHCRNCKNKKTTLCEIRKDINGKYKCVYEEK